MTEQQVHRGASLLKLNSNIAMYECQCMPLVHIGLTLVVKDNLITTLHYFHNNSKRAKPISTIERGSRGKTLSFLQLL